MPTSFSEVMNSLEPDYSLEQDNSLEPDNSLERDNSQDADSTEAHIWSACISENWMQGRTTYGGLSAALCLKAVLNTNPDLPPLRTAQVNFIGPVGAQVSIRVQTLRRGKSVAFVSAEMTTATGIATHCVFCFGQSRESFLDREFIKSPKVPGVADSEEMFKDRPGPTFTNNFDCRIASGDQPMSGSEKSEIFLWARNKDRAANDVVALLGLADMPPPAVLPMFKQFAPISSMTWMLNFLEENPSTEDGWWLMSSIGENAKNGYSSQDMAIWNTAGKLVVTGRQNVAIFT